MKKKPIYDNRAPSYSNLTGDKVTIDEENGIYSVVTASGTQMTLTVPFGVCCITQDVYQQLEVCLNLYTDVNSALNGASLSQQLLAFIGFDACLMASVETALTVAPFADYMIASQDAEPGDGWNSGRRWFTTRSWGRILPDRPFP